MPAVSAADGVSLQVLPGKIGLSATDATTATVLVTNGTSSKVSGLRLRPVFTGTPSSEATISPQRPLALAAGQTRTFALKIRPWASTGAPPSLSLLAEFTSDKLKQVVASSVELSAPAPLEADKIATVEVKASLTTLRSGQAEPVYLLVTNKSAQVLEVKEVLTSQPDFIEFDSRGQKDIRIAPGEVSVLTLQAKAASRVKPGDHQLVFKLPARIGEVDFDLVATQTAKVGVAGETEILTALGIPSLLLLPGFLVIATASLLWRLRFLRKEWDGAAFPFPLKEAEFWVLAVLFSVAIVLLANQIADIDLLDRYGLSDLIKIWLASMVAGFLIYVFVVPIRNWWRKSRVPARDDDPCTVLKKLAKQKLTLELPAFSSDTGSTSINLFLAQPDSETRPSTWASPQITFTWVNDVDTALNERIQQQLNVSHDAAALAANLEKGLEEGTLDVSFADGHSPTLVAKEKIGITSPAVIVGQV